MSTEKAKVAEPPSFDTNLSELESIVESLERGDTSLENLLEKYERGMKLHAECQRVLRGAELRIEQLREEEGKLRFVDVSTAPGSSDSE
jgi:exodeoxyribonuclease VII small subunit